MDLGAVEARLFLKFVALPDGLRHPCLLGLQYIVLFAQCFHGPWLGSTLLPAEVAGHEARAVPVVDWDPVSVRLRGARNTEHSRDVSRSVGSAQGVRVAEVATRGVQQNG